MVPLPPVAVPPLMLDEVVPAVPLGVVPAWVPLPPVAVPPLTLDEVVPAWVPLSPVAVPPLMLDEVVPAWVPLPPVAVSPLTSDEVVPAWVPLPPVAVSPLTSAEVAASVPLRSELEPVVVFVLASEKPEPPVPLPADGFVAPVAEGAYIPVPLVSPAMFEAAPGCHVPPVVASNGLLRVAPAGGAAAGSAPVLVSIVPIGVPPELLGVSWGGGVKLPGS
ncbi:hypothetical protein A176_000112 [Myxococcus hansupus]|uniref:Uncharacterized protein n=1 Tax=Pseudomyxococcus hansupus TaxID=1297742 RepID=A0A0H4WPD9_9BACT|nr:hypothetical protein A176_000112 [Myxococcus hansupus]